MPGESCLDRIDINQSPWVKETMNVKGSRPIDLLLNGILPRSEASSIIFVRRPLGRKIAFNTAGAYIPTPHLNDMFARHLKDVTNQQRIDLYFALSSHALTRSVAGWAHEKIMHERLSRDGAALGIFQGSVAHTMQSSTNLLPGTLNGLGQAGVDDSFYWLPSVANFPGVDSVLGTPDGRLYMIQATIADEHTNPEQGIGKVWASVSKEVRMGRTWHFVVVAATKDVTEKYVREYSGKLGLGEKPVVVDVDVWGALL